MTRFMTKKQAEVLKKTTAEKAYSYFGEIHPYIFNEWDDANYNGDIMYILITHLGKYQLNKSIFKKAKCPVCGKEELSVYSCCASVLNGAHVLRGYCPDCNELIAFDDNDYYHMIRDYIIENRNILNKSPNNCPLP